MPPVASLPTDSNRRPRSNVSRGDTVQWSVAKSDVVVMSIVAPRCGSQTCTREMFGTKRGISAAVGVERRAVAGVELVVGLEDVAGRGLRVAADPGRDEVLEPALDFVRSEPRATTAGATGCRSTAGCCAVRDPSSRNTARCTAGRPEHRACRES